MQGFKVYLVLAFLGGAVQLKGAAIKTRYKDVEVNWSTLRIRFHGQARAAENNLKKSEQLAWQQGLSYIKSTVPGLRKALLADASENAQNQSRATQIARSTYSTNTIYFSDGTIRVELENLLARALGQPYQFKHQSVEDPPEAKKTGIILSLDRRIEPKPVYSIRDEAGQVLFSVDDVAQEAYERHLMGHWFRSADDYRVSHRVGADPIQIVVKVQSDGRLMVPRELWRQSVAGNENLLRAVRLVLISP